jgi:hypothetical protein
MEMIIGPLFSCTYLPLPYLGMTAMSGYEQLPGAHTPAFEIPLIAGPTAYFPTPSFDLVFGVLPHLAYCSGFREGGSSYEATWRGDLLVDWGIIFYRYGSLGDPINYFRIDLQLSFLSGSWNRDFGDPQEAGPNSRLYFAIGRRL